MTYHVEDFALLPPPPPRPLLLPFLPLAVRIAALPLSRYAHLHDPTFAESEAVELLLLVGRSTHYLVTFTFVLATKLIFGIGASKPIPKFSTPTRPPPTPRFLRETPPRRTRRRRVPLRTEFGHVLP